QGSSTVLRFSKMELDLAARALCQSLDLASGGRERVLDRDLDVPVAPVIGRLVADHDVPVGRNRYPDVDTIDGTVAVLRTRRDDRARPRLPLPWRAAYCREVQCL